MPRHPLFYVGLISVVIGAFIIASVVTGWPRERRPEITIISLN